MAGSLVLIQETTLSSPQATVSLTGIDTSFDVYKVVVSGIQPVTDNKNLLLKVTKGGTKQDDSEYDSSGKLLKSSASFSNSQGVDGTSFTFAFSLSNATNETANAILYLFNFANSSEFSFITAESSFLQTDSSLVGFQGGFAHTVASASDGVHFSMESSVNINTGAIFKLYGLNK